MSSTLLQLSIFFTFFFISTASHSNNKATQNDPIRQHQAVILQYHHVSTDTPASTSVSPDVFIEHLDLIEGQGFEVKPLEFVIENIKNNIPFSNKTVAITFDDGYDSIYLAAYPQLKSRGLPFTVFICPKAIDKSHGSTMTWEQLKEMDENGGYIANHSFEHLHLLEQLENETEIQWQDRIKQDITTAQQRLEAQLGPRLKYFAYPYGEFNETLKNLLKNEGYIAFAQQSGAVNRFSDMQSLPRFPASGVYANVKTLTTKLNSLAFPVIQYSPEQKIRKANDLTPQISLTVEAEDIRYHQAQCYFSGSPVPTTTVISENQLIIQAQYDGTLPLGRSRYNCTAPSKTQKGYYWFSMPFISTNEEQNWQD
ncbi:polysaccharide deacetylase family protein [Bermanella sp. WJH001]|uniref:polysaccharide deacetylase family protein n=1 Tax=Bermanella sp. WJH001 TaxID=3048005 RepID=UPI0024BDF323|nr:polysaccharide deacetylase family protein [Bermanella sp. WJH001]MDJ1536626.1 polysaccharide deacetylase family protein [Bermanella sp. WJH001]